MSAKLLLLYAFFLFSISSSALTYGAPDQITSLSPYADTTLTQWQIQRLAYDFLLIEVPGQRDVFRPGLAKSWKISKDKKVFHFELRKAQWSDQKPVTIEDVKFSVENILDPKYKNPWLSSFSLIEKVEILSPKQLRITLKKADFEVFKNIAVVLKILPKSFYLDPFSEVYKKQLHGSGPYKLSSFKPPNFASLEKNLAWWGWSDPELKSWYKPEKIIFQAVPTATIAGSYFQKNLIDLYPLSSSNAIRNLNLRSKSEVYFVIDPNKNQEIIEQIFFNFKDKIFSDIKMRIALNLLVDRFDLCKKVYASSKILLPFDKKNGLSQLKELGWIDSNKDGVLDRVIDGKLTSLEFDVLYSSSESEMILTSLKENFKIYGIEINLKSTDSSLFWKILNEKKFQSYLNTQDQKETVLSSEWQSSGFYNNQSFFNAVVDQDFLLLSQTFEPSKRKKLTQDIHKKIAADMPSLILCQINHSDFAIRSSYEKSKIIKGLPIWGWFNK